MGKYQQNQTTAALPLAPIIYVNQHGGGDEHLNKVAQAVHSLIEKSSCSTRLIPTIFAQGPGSGKIPGWDLVRVVTDRVTTGAAERADLLHKGAIAWGSNFASVQVYYEEPNAKIEAAKWNTNHMDITVGSSTAEEMGERIYKWLFKVFTVPETLHLIPEKEMLAIDSKSFPDYAYCPISDARKHPKDAKIQFVALITSKPAVGKDKRLHWTVTDRTGTANFYFSYRGPSSKYTWEWVLALQPGDRKALPRMPCVKVKERKRVTVGKAPFRGVAFVVGGTGTAIKAVGQTLCAVGNKLKMGNRSEWVPEADVKPGQVVGTKTAPPAGKTEIKIFNEKGEKLWKWDDEDGDASTTAGSIYDEKTERE